MADKKISDFSTLTELSDNDLLLISSGQTTYNTRFATVKGEAADAAVDEISSSVVRHDVTQSLNTEAKTRARTNIDAASVSAVNTAQTTADNAVKYNAAQSLNTTEKAMARSNINAMDASNSVVLYTTQTLTTDQQAQARANIGVSSGGVTGAVLYDSVQSLSSSEQATARGNIGAMDADASVVRYTSQTLDSTQKLQARTNIGAMDEDSAVVKYSAQSLTTAQQEQARSNIDAVGTDDLTGIDITPNGVAVGGTSSGTASDKKFEVDASYTAHFYGGIEGVTNYSTTEVASGGKWINGKPLYRKLLVWPTGVSTGSSVSIGVNVDYMSILWANVNIVRSGNTVVNWYTPGFYAGSGTYVYFNANTDSGTIGCSVGSSYRMAAAWALIEYTKTSDPTPS